MSDPKLHMMTDIVVTLESSYENCEAETVEQTGRARDATHEGSGNTTSRGGIQAAGRSLIATVVPTRSETHSPEEGAYPRQVYAWPQTFGLQDNDPSSSWSIYEPPTGRSNQSIPSAPSIPAPVSFPALHTRIHMRGEYTIAGVAEDSERVRNFAIWLQREYERTNLQIMGERDAWVSELRGSAGLRSRSSLVGEYREPNSIAAM